MKKLIIFWVLACSYGIKSMGQGNPFFKQPMLVASSPEAASLARVSELPVDLSSGTANLSIPIYTIEDGNISIPVSINYNTGGIRVQDVAGSAGLGWSLDFGGGINVQSELCDPARTIDKSQYIQNSDFRNKELEGALSAAYAIIDGKQEKQKPEYFFHFGKYSGSFFYDIYNQLYKKGNQLLVIEKLPSGFRITNPEGIQYTFANAENVTATNAWTRVSAYFVTQITDLNTHRSVTFKYKPSSFTEYHDTYSVCWVTQKPSPVLCNMVGSDSYNRTISYIDRLVIDTIQFSTGYVKFFSSADRLDKDPNRITQISIYDKNNKEIRRVKFNQSYFVSTGGAVSSDNYRLRLDSLAFYNTQDNSVVEPYRFFYDNTVPPPYTNSFNNRNFTGIDYWGYYNGKSGNGGLLPKGAVDPADFVTYGPISGFFGDRKADSNSNQVFMLKRVKYPTGGYIQFGYEANVVPGNFLGNVVGGVRVRYINYYNDWHDYKPARSKYYLYDSCIMDKSFSQNGYMYNKVKTVLCDRPADCTAPFKCRTDFQTRNVSSDPLGINAYFRSSPFYFQVQELEMDLDKPIARTIYYYDKINQYEWQGWPAPEYDNLYFAKKDWLKDNLLIKAESFKVDSAGGFSLVKREEYQYNDYLVAQPRTGVHVATRNYYDFCGQSLRDYNPWSTAAQGLYGMTIYNAHNSVGVRNLNKKKVTEYFSADSLVTETSMYYSLYQLLNIVQTTNSKGKETKTIYYYPFSFYPSGDAMTAKDSLVRRNIISTPMAKIELEDNIEVSREVINYKVWNPGNEVVYPESKQIRFGSNPLETRLQYYGYDYYGNPTSVSNSNDIIISYIWGYDGKYVIAQAKNASSNEIAYTSFEDYANVSGNWNIAGLGRGTGDGITGNQYATGSGSLTGPSINAANKYIVSYWTKNNTPFSISGTQAGYPVKVKTVNGWTCYEHLVSGITSVQINISGSIDEVRMYPRNAQMMTYAFQPLVGMTAQCDINNRVTYYEYDGFNRMVIVRDQDRNVIKKNLYNYDPKPGDSKIIYFNTARSLSGTKSCPVGYAASTVTYTVPGGRYNSDVSQALADGQANADITANAQNYFDANSVCTLPPSSTLTYLNSSPTQHFQLTLSNAATNQSYKFFLDPNVTGTPVNLGNIAQGVYSVVIIGLPSPGRPYTFTFNNVTQSDVYHYSASGVPVSCATCATVNIY